MEINLNSIFHIIIKLSFSNQICRHIFHEKKLMAKKFK